MSGTSVAYAGAAESWSRGAMLAYGPLARHLCDRIPMPLAGAQVLDAGAGTGAATEVLRARGAVVVAADLEHGMLAGRSDPATPAVTADVLALPLRSGAFDAAVAAFVLNHLADPVAGLRELGRVVRARGAVVASSFARARAAAKDVVDDTAASFGWRTPSWYAQLGERAAAVSTVEQLQRAADAAGLVDARVTETDVDVGLHDPALVARYRLAMPQLAGFVRSLSPVERERLERAATDAVAATRVAFRPRVLELVARVSRDAPRSAPATPDRAHPPRPRAAAPIGGR